VLESLIVCVLIFAVVACLQEDSGSKLSFQHSNALNNASSIVVSVKTPSASSTKSTTLSPTTTTVTIPPSTTLPTLPNQHRWSVAEDSGNVCLLLESGIRMKFNYAKQVGSSISNSLQTPIVGWGHP